MSLFRGAEKRINLDTVRAWSPVSGTLGASLLARQRYDTAVYERSC